jgi:hypothetical protein
VSEVTVNACELLELAKKAGMRGEVTLEARSDRELEVVASHVRYTLVGRDGSGLMALDPTERTREGGVACEVEAAGKPLRDAGAALAKAAAAPAKAQKEREASYDKGCKELREQYANKVSDIAAASTKEPSSRQAVRMEELNRWTTKELAGLKAAHPERGQPKPASSGVEVSVVPGALQMRLIEGAATGAWTVPGGSSGTEEAAAVVKRFDAHLWGLLLGTDAGSKHVTVRLEEDGPAVIRHVIGAGGSVIEFYVAPKYQACLLLHGSSLSFHGP